MTYKRLLAAALTLLLTLAACKPSVTDSPNPRSEPAHIYLYGEYHGRRPILEAQLEAWGEHYANGLRHLFVEAPCFTAEYMNIWMQEEDDKTLDRIFEEWRNRSAPSCDPIVYDFYKQIKLDYPETIFHGTDIGFDHSTLGQGYLKHLILVGLGDTEQADLTRAVIKQGGHYNSTRDDIYRENMMAENFIAAFDALDGQSIVGFYGAAHTRLDSMAFYGGVENMATQLQAHYGDIITSVDLSPLAFPPQRTDEFTINGKTYTASYFGEQDISQWSELYVSRRFWRLEDAYDDFKDMTKTGQVAPYGEYPMPVELNQVFLIEYTLASGTIVHQFYRSDGLIWEDLTVTEQVDPASPEYPVFRIAEFTINDKPYTIFCFAEEDISSWSEEFVTRRFWRFEGAYDDFKDAPKTGDVLPYSDYPATMMVAVNQVFLIDYVRADGSNVFEFHRSDGLVRDDLPVTEAFTLGE